MLGLDLSLTASGAAVLVDGVAAERWLLKTNGSASDLERCDYIATETMKVVFAGGDPFTRDVDVVALEGVYASRNLLTYGRLTTLSAIVQYALWRSRVPYVVLTPASWRTAVFGPKSKVDKEKVRAAAAMRLKDHLGTIDVERVDLNVLEAFLVGLAAWKIETGQAVRPAPKRARKAPSA